MTELVLTFASFVLGLAWGRIRRQRREIIFWRSGAERWLKQYQQLSMEFFGRHLQVVHDEIVAEIPDKRSWDDVPELEVVNKTEEDDVL